MTAAPPPGAPTFYGYRLAFGIVSIAGVGFWIAVAALLLGFAFVKPRRPSRPSSSERPAGVA